MSLDNRGYPFLSLSSASPTLPPCVARALLRAAHHHGSNVRQYDAGKLCM